MHLKRGGLPSKQTPPPLLPCCCCCCCCFCWCVITVIINTVVKNFSSGQGQKYTQVLRCRVVLDELSPRHSGMSKCVCTCNARCLRRAYAARPQLQATARARTRMLWYTEDVSQTAHLQRPCTPPPPPLHTFNHAAPTLTPAWLAHTFHHSIRALAHNFPKS